MNKHKNTTCGFTLIETLVAISILMIAIAGPLTVANKAYHTALGTRDQVIATNLAQEAMEYINYWKDNRNNVGGEMTNFVGWEPVGAIVPRAFTKCRNEVDGCDITGTPAGFTRYYYFTDRNTNPIVANPNTGLVINQVLAHVVVKWKGSGGEERETVLKTILTNHAR